MARRRRDPFGGLHLPIDTDGARSAHRGPQRQAIWPRGWRLEAAGPFVGLLSFWDFSRALHRRGWGVRKESACQYLHVVKKPPHTPPFFYLPPDTPSYEYIQGRTLFVNPLRQALIKRCIRSPSFEAACPAVDPTAPPSLFSPPWRAMPP